MAPGREVVSDRAQGTQPLRGARPAPANHHQRVRPARDEHIQNLREHEQLATYLIHPFTAIRDVNPVGLHRAPFGRGETTTTRHSISGSPIQTGPPARTPEPATHMSRELVDPGRCDVAEAIGEPLPLAVAAGRDRRIACSSGSLRGGHPGRYAPPGRVRRRCGLAGAGGVPDRRAALGSFAAATEATPVSLCPVGMAPGLWLALVLGVSRSAYASTPARAPILGFPVAHQGKRFRSRHW
jgi:hypothetical protein